MTKATLISIAEQTGYSVTTVSRALSGQGKKYRISENTIHKITEEAQKSNYTPSIIAQSLRTNKTRTLGLVVPSIENPFFANIASVIIQKAKSYGYTVVLADAMENENDERECIGSLLARNVDGIMISPSGVDPKYLEVINDSKVPVVLIDRFFPNSTLPHVTTDNYRGALEAVRFLIDSGHRKIACIQGAPHSIPVVERVRGYCDAMKSSGLEREIKLVGNSFSIQNGYVETKLLLGESSPPTAVFALSNTILLGAVKAVADSNLQVPGDISIISFDDNTYLDYMSPPITRIVQPIDEIGTLGVKILLQSIQEPRRSDARIKLPARLVVRKSVAPVNGTRPEPKACEMVVQ